MVDKKIQPEPEVKYEVFISSTNHDFVKPIKRCIIDKTLEMGYIPCYMESFTRTDDVPKNYEEVEKNIERSDIFVLIVGADYGSVFNGKSYIDFEYEHAKKFNKPRIILLLNKERADELRKGMINENKFDDAYKAFRDQFDAHFSIVFDYTADLKKLRLNTNDYIKELNRAKEKLKGKGGWYRSNSELMADIIAKFVSNTTLINRTKKDSDLKEAIAQVFLGKYLPSLVRKNYLKFFFESGSSTAFLAKEFVDLFMANSNSDWGVKTRKVQIKTNNSLAYFYFLWGQSLDKLCLYPQGSPQNKYGATLGDLEEVDDEPMSNIHGSYIGQKAKSALTKFTNEFNEDYMGKASKKTGKGIIFMAASGVEIGAGKLGGPHVGSYRNMLFKKALLASKCPTVMFLDQTKLPKEKENRHFICDDILTWHGICDGRIKSPFADPSKSFSKPFAIAIGLRTDAANANKEKEIRNIFKGLELEVIAEDKPGEDILVLVAANEYFEKIFSQT